MELLKEDPDSLEIATELESTFSKFRSFVDDLELTSYLSGPHDGSNCYLSLNAGAGGTDAQDWAEMMLRMYLRWCEAHDYTVEVMEQTMGDEAGIKSVTLLVKGHLAYGYLKNEGGVHRMVRLSPFNSNNKRQTSFAAVDVMPEIDYDAAKIDIDPKDLKVDTYRASGAGGQHVNKTDSAVRITHLPTGLVAQCQTSRSQAGNKEAAMSILTSRLIVLLEKQHKETLSEIRGDVKDIAWGHQIRSYVFHPYKLVKDLRTNVETSNISAVMDGDLDGFIQAQLKNQKDT